MTAPQTMVGPIDEVKTRVKTYLAMGRLADKRNIPFLRTAWRTERDPAVRAVVADSLYLSDPQDYLNARTLVDSFLATDEVYGRLRSVSRDLAIEVPGLASMVELAAAGNLDALARIVELARASTADEAARAQISEALSEVGRTAPDELLLSMRQGGIAEREATTSLLAQGLVKAADPEHPFWPSLKSAMGAVDPELSTFARQMEEALSIQIAAAKAPPTPPIIPAEGKPSAPPTSAETRPGG
jgi:D-alanyl-D-alanine carboxypeptidase/D-alanyl-D-alanine-endopeptidase (penicillin-binding protein 4)